MLLPVVSLFLVLVAVHLWCDCIPRLDPAEVLLAFIGLPLPCVRIVLRA